MKPFPIPLVALGPGTQPEDEPLNYLPMPQGMETFRTPRLELDASPQQRALAFDSLAHLAEAMRNTPFGAASTPRLQLLGMDTQVRALINDALGQGEVAAQTGGAQAARLQETAFAGIWRVQRDGPDGQPTSDLVEASALPALVREAALAGARPDPGLAPPPGVMNAPVLLHELREVAATYRDGQPAHIINLTLLPVTTEDLEFLADALGPGNALLLSRGYGNCRITATAVANVWWVQYFNSMDALILNTLEVVDVPEVALAAREDYLDSIERLEEWIAVSREG